MMADDACAADDVRTAVARALQPFVQLPQPFVCTDADAAASRHADDKTLRCLLSPSPSVELLASAYAGRAATLRFAPYDLPCDDAPSTHPRDKDGIDDDDDTTTTMTTRCHEFVRVCALPPSYDSGKNTTALLTVPRAHNNKNNNNNNKKSSTAASCTATSRFAAAAAAAAEAAATIAPLTYYVSADAAPFSALLCTLARAGVTRVFPAAAADNNNNNSNSNKNKNKQVDDDNNSSQAALCASLRWCARCMTRDFVSVYVRHITTTTAATTITTRAQGQQQQQTPQQTRWWCVQRVNHFPGTWRLGKKDELHRSLCRATRRWQRAAHASSSSRVMAGGNSSGDNNDVSTLYPRAWVVPDEEAACLAALRAPEAAGRRFIVKPTTSACGRGIVLLRGAHDVTLPTTTAAATTTTTDEGAATAAAAAVQKDEAGGDVKTTATTTTPRRARCWTSARIAAARAAAQRSRARRLLVQQYVDDPYLVHGYKFDLRLYVVVTSFAPVRAYVHSEGLVRFATTRYTQCNNNSNNNNNNNNNNNSSGGDDDDDVLTAHLTNFTVNKTTAQFVSHTCAATSSDTTRSNSNKNKNSNKKDDVSPSKWPLAALRAYMTHDGVDWHATMTRVRALLSWTLLAVVPEVRDDLVDVQRRRSALYPHEAHAQCCTCSSGSSSGDDTTASAATTTCPMTFGGVCPFFEVYGVDVLLRRPAHGTRVCAPVLMEVNVMPSLSTHYSALDQCVKGNVIADTLTLLGLVPPEAATGAVSPASDHGSQGAHDAAFLRRLPCACAREACMTAADEQRRARAAHFVRLLPTATSATDYAALLRARVTSEDEDDGGAIAASDVDGSTTTADELLSRFVAWQEQRAGAECVM